MSVIHLHLYIGDLYIKWEMHSFSDAFSLIFMCPGVGDTFLSLSLSLFLSQTDAAQSSGRSLGTES